MHGQGHKNDILMAVPGSSSSAFFGRFIPEEIGTRDEVRAWRHIISVCVVASPTYFVFAVVYSVLGAILGAIFLFTGAAVFAALPWVLKTTQRSLPIIMVVLLGFMLTLAMLALSKPNFTLSTVMWLALMPLVALFAHGVKAMRFVLILSLAIGTACFVLLQNDLSIGGFPGNPEIQNYVDFIVWLVFMLVATAIGHEFNANQKAEESRRVEVEVILERTKRMRAIGELAGGVAHEFNNLLAVIGGTARVLHEDLVGNLDAEQGLSDIERAVTRGTEISGELLAFARGQEDSGMQRADVADSVWACVRLILPVVGRDIEVRTNISSELPTAAVTPRTIEQAVVNIALNSKAAMPMGGVLTICAERIELAAAEATLLAIRPGSWVRVRISDNGSGMDKETLARIYEPFFTTKDEGTGLGLAVVFGLLERAGGCVSMESKIGEGTETSLYLPLAESDSETEVETATQTLNGDVSAVSATVLLVEDQDAVRKMVRRILTRAGHTVHEATNGVDALECIKQFQFDLVVSDVCMPRMGGAKLAETIRKQGDDMPIIFMTGFAGNEEKGLALGTAVLQKPFAPDTLVAAIADALAARSRKRQSRRAG